MPPSLPHLNLNTSQKPHPDAITLEVRLQHEFGGKHKYAVLDRGDSASLRMGLAEYPEVGLGKGSCGGKIEGEKEEGGRSGCQEADVPGHLLCASAVLAIV